MDQSVLIGAVVGVLSGGGLSGLLLLPRTQRKLDAEAAEVLTGAAVALVKPLQDKIEGLTTRVAQLEARERRQAELLVAHAAWDALAAAALKGAGIEMPDAPPLHVESDFPHATGRDQGEDQD